MIMIKNMVKNHGKKALIAYLCWCLLKGLAYLTLGVYLFK